MKKNQSNTLNYIIFLVFLGFIGVSYLINFDFGKKIGDNFMIFARDMILILPPAFVIIGLFEIWVDRDMIEKSFGKISGIRKYVYSVMLAATTVGGTFVAFPVANSLYHKGAEYNAIFTYITSASLFMIPMSIMEASILGIKFTAIRLGVSLPFIILSAVLLAKYFNSIGYELPENV